MQSAPFLRFLAWPPLFFICLTLGLIVHANETSKTPREGPKIVTSQDLGGEKRYLTHTSTDKPIYRAGDTVYVRSVLLNAHDQKPYGEENALLTIKILGPKGDQLMTQGVAAEESTFGLSWKVPKNTPGGVHKIVVESPMGLAPKAERTFEIRTYRPSLHDIDITYVKKGYGPGDSVEAKVEIQRADGSIPSGARMVAIARLDGQEIHREELSFPRDGFTKLSFELPTTIRRGEGTLFISLLDGAKDSSHGKSIPILLQTVDIEFYPEGGELVEGLTSKVYFQAWRPDGQPADITGELYDASGSSAGVTMSTEHEGRGHFSFIPDHRQLFLKVTEPSGIRATYALPKPLKKGAVLETENPVLSSGQEFKLSVQNSGMDLGWITLAKREKVLDRLDLRGQNAGGHYSLNPKEGVGSLILTLWSSSGLPLSERLVFVHPKEEVELQVEVKTDYPSPGDEVEVEITSRNKDGDPIEALVGITVTDLRTQEMIENREQAPRLPEMVFLEAEVEELKDAKSYLRSHVENRESNLDLLLGVQGWRRFLIAKNWKASPNQDETEKRAMAKVNQRLQNLREGKNLVRRRGAIVLAVPIVEEMMVADGGMDDEIAFAAIDVAAMQMSPPPVPDEGQPVLNGTPAIRPERKKKREDFNLAQEQAKIVAPMAEIVAGARVARLRQMPRQFTILREYSHSRKKPISNGNRSDFTETLYWHAGKKTDATTGKTTLRFQLSDSITRYQIQADAFTKEGALGSTDGHVDVSAPFYIEPKWPLHLVEGDRVHLPVGVIGQKGKEVELHLSCPSLELEESFILESASQRMNIPFEAFSSGSHTFTLSASCGDESDRITHSLIVTPKGFPIQLQSGGILKPGMSGEMEVPLPASLQPGSLSSVIQIYPTPQASLDGALKSLIRQPHGCFEQTSSTSYPLVMAQQYFLSHQGVDPEMIAKSRELLKKGYQRLIGYECEEGGYEWFGKGPGHEGLTAYGLMQFHDMSEVMEIDQAMVKRTREWLLSRRDGKGSFKKNSKKLDSFGGASSELTDAYLVWALLESGEAPGVLQKEIEQLMRSNANNEDPYIQALMANLLYLAGEKTEAEVYLNKLSKAQGKEGMNEGAVTSITSSRGPSLTVETTSLAILAWLKAGKEWLETERKALNWLHTQGKSGRFGNTQATILALKAIVSHDKAFAKPAHPGELWLSLDDIQITDRVSFTTETRQTIVMPDIAAALRPGAKQRLKVHMSGGSPMPFTFEVNYHSPLPASVDQPSIQFSTKLAHGDITEGEPTNLNIRVEANSDTPTPILILGLPGGLELRHDQLKSWVAEDKIASYETGEGTLAIYWRGLKKGQVVELPLDLIANLPGGYRAVSSIAYPYYEEENVLWVEGCQINILPR